VEELLWILALVGVMGWLARAAIRRNRVAIEQLGEPLACCVGCLDTTPEHGAVDRGWHWGTMHDGAPDWLCPACRLGQVDTLEGRPILYTFRAEGHSDVVSAIRSIGEAARETARGLTCAG
jgi:hypothetical protein